MKREGTQRPNKRRDVPVPPSAAPQPVGLKKRVRFVYNGNSSLTVTGIVSGRQYTFTRPGDIVEVDERDRHMLLAMPSLKQL
jgi:hypothetical protein